MKSTTKQFDSLRSICESTPFKEISCKGVFNIEICWTARPGIYGYQVHHVVRDYRGEEVVVTFGRTAGCGYDKEDNALENAFHTLGISPRGMSLGGESIPHEYHVGGNFYRVNKADMLKIK